MSTQQTGQARPRPGRLPFDAPRGAPTEEEAATAEAVPVRPLAERVIAASVVAALALRISVGPDITPGLVLSLLLLPIWLPPLRRFRGARTLIAVILAAIVSGYLLAWFAVPGHRVIATAQLNTATLMLTLVGGLGLVLWSREYLTPVQIGLSFGAGLTVNSVLNGGGALAVDNPLKFAWALPVTLVLLGLAALSRRRIFQVLALAALCVGLSYVDARSLFAICLLSLMLLLWQYRPSSASRSSSWTWTAVLLAAVGFAAYQFSAALLVDGVLGADAQQRSVQQIQSSGSLLLGGRPELGATLALIGYRPMGLGSGVVASFDEISVAKQGMASFGYDPNNGYVDNFMFGGKAELHSLLGDAWGSFGLVGLLLVVVVTFHVVRGVAVRVADGTGTGLALVLGVLSLWNVLFSPIFATVPTLQVALGLLLISNRPTSGERTAYPGGRTVARFVGSR